MRIRTFLLYHNLSINKNKYFEKNFNFNHTLSTSCILYSIEHKKLNKKFLEVML
nr:MAG TPA: hypothetical protein [Caudoviricetes sp.]